MKVLLLVFPIILAHTFCVTAGFYVDYGNSLVHLAIPVKNSIEKKCLTTGNPKQFEHAIDELGHCIYDLMRESPGFDLSDYNQNHCSFFNENQLRVCVKNLTTNLLPCLAEDEIYIQQFLLNAFDIFYEELCGADRISNKQYIYDKINRTGDCMELSALLLYSYGACNTTHLNIFKDLDKEILSLNKHDVCSDIESLHKCTTQLTEAVCNEEYSRFTDLIFHPFLEGCNDLDARK